MAQAISKPRYELRFRNGTFHVFDTVYYGVVGTHWSRKLAQERADELNQRRKGK